MAWSALESKNSLNWFLSHNGIAEAVGNVRELLLLSPLHIIGCAFIVIVVMSMLSILKGLLEIDLLSLREPGAGRLSPSVIEIEEHVVEVLILVTDRLYLVEVRRNVGHLIKVLGSHLTNVKVNHVAVVSVDLIQLLRGKRISLHPVLHMHMLVRKNDRGVSVMISGRLLVDNLDVSCLLILIDLEEEV